MGWDGPIFTDSGGFQIFSLGEKMQKRNKDNNETPPFNIKIAEEGVSFQIGSSGEKRKLTPELSIRIQNNLGSDIALVLDEFPGYPFEYTRAKLAVERTTRWATRAKEEFIRLKKRGQINPGQVLLGIIQGANFPDLRKKSAKDIRAIGFDGYAIGGVAVGEPQAEMLKAIEACIPFLEENKFRHLLGVGTPEDIIQAVARGCDSFDCVIPTREARHGKAYISAGHGYQTINISRAEFKKDLKPLDKNCDCFACQHHSRAYLSHLFKSGEILAIRLLTEHNLRFYLNLMKKIRESIIEGSFRKMLKEFKKKRD
jgi:queuine tRNA-ribosyltransferase